jgi:hypothetical protein
MARRGDPERIFNAQRAGVRARQTGTGMTPETADRWLWQAGWEWIATERAARRLGW